MTFEEYKYILDAIQTQVWKTLELDHEEWYTLNVLDTLYEDIAGKYPQYRDKMKNELKHIYFG